MCLEEVRQECNVAQSNFCIAGCMKGYQLLTLAEYQQMGVVDDALFWRKENWWMFYKDKKKDTHNRIDTTFEDVIDVYDKCLATLYLQSYRQKLLLDYTGLCGTWITIGTLFL